jgi:SH3-like domain-containing protein
MTTTAKTILEQLGGNKFLVMTGAKNLMAGADASLIFTLPRFPGLKINRVKIRLTPADTYEMTFMRYSAKTLQVDTLATVEDVYCDMLRSVFTSQTGLDCTL